VSCKYTYDSPTHMYDCAHYYPYGEEITSTANDTNKYAKMYRDSDSGLDYAKRRYYSSALGRFLTPDPKRKSAHAKSPQTWNRYAYARNNPVNRIDPLGKEDCEVDDPSCVDGCTVDTAKNHRRDRDSQVPVEADRRGKWGKMGSSMISKVKRADGVALSTCSESRLRSM